jgi:hypothetical protein
MSLASSRSQILRAAVLLSIVPRLLGQVGSVDVSVETVEVTLPPAIAALWEPQLTELHYTTRGAEIDRLLLIGGSHCRWAQRTSAGKFAWDSTGYVLAGRIPQDLPSEWDGWQRPLSCYIDMLGPADAEPSPRVGQLYPRLVSYLSKDERFVIGVPGPGRWTAIVNQSGGPAELLATLEAVPDGSLPATLPVATVQSYNCRVRLDITGVPKAAEAECLSEAGWSGSVSLAPVSDSYDRQVEFQVQALNSATISWLWHSGWEVQRVDGRAFTSYEQVIERKVQPESALRVRVVDAPGGPIAEASVMLLDASGNRVPAGWGPDVAPDQARLFWWGKTDAEGVVYAHGVPTGLELTVRASAGGFQSASMNLPRGEPPGPGEEASRLEITLIPQ